MKTQKLHHFYYFILFISMVGTSSAMSESELGDRFVNSYRRPQTIVQESLATVQVKCLDTSRVPETITFFYTKNDIIPFSLREILQNCPSIWDTLDCYNNKTWVEINAHRKNVVGFQIRCLVDRNNEGVLSLDTQ